MAALPYMQFFVADYLADTAHLNTNQHGAYLLLIMNYWQRGKPLPAKDEYLAQICRLNLDQWLEIKPVIEEFFTVKKDQWTHKRIDKDLLAVTSKSIKASEAGKKGAAQRTLNERLANAEQSLNQAQAQAQAQTEAHAHVDEEKELSFTGTAEQLTPEWQLFAKACVIFGSSPDGFLTDTQKQVLRQIRGDRRIGPDKLIAACENRARAPDVPGEISVDYFLNKFEYQERITKWAKGIPKYGKFSDNKKTGGSYTARNADKGDGKGWDHITTVATGTEIIRPRDR